MHGAALSGWKLPCFPGSSVSHLWGFFFFFSVQIISPCLGCTCGCPWVSPVAEKEETPSQARALYPKHSPGCYPSPHGHFKGTKAEVTDLDDIPSFPCTALVTGCMIKQQSSGWAGSAAQLCREGLQTAWAIWVCADVLLLSLGASTQLPNTQGHLWENCWGDRLHWRVVISKRVLPFTGLIHPLSRSLSPPKHHFAPQEGGDSFTPHRFWCTHNQQSSSAWELF